MGICTVAGKGIGRLTAMGYRSSGRTARCGLEKEQRPAAGTGEMREINEGIDFREQRAKWLHLT